MSVLNQVAEEYVRLCFSLEEFSPGYVDAYFGPEQLKNEGKEAKGTLQQIRQSVPTLLAALSASDNQEPLAQEPLARRVKSLRVHLLSLLAKVDLQLGISLSFDQESEALYDAICPSFAPEEFLLILREIESLLSEGGSLNERVNSLRDKFLIPPERLAGVMQRAIEEARARTRRWIPLPKNESFQVEYVTGKPWSGYNWFKGDALSLIQVNTDLPIHLDLVVNLACHEGYPGHHLFNSLREQELYRKYGWVEFSIFPLFGPEALLAEGSANFAQRMVFPHLDERVQFEREVLCPLAGLPTDELEKYETILELTGKLGYVRVETARRYIDGQLTRSQAIEWLQKYQLLPSEEAEKALDFIDYYRSYVINYQLGQDLVRVYLERRGGTSDRPEVRWREFQRLLTEPILPSDLR